MNHAGPKQDNLKNEGDLINEDDLKNEDYLKNEDDLKNENYLKNEDDLKDDDDSLYLILMVFIFLSKLSARSCLRLHTKLDCPKIARV